MQLRPAIHTDGIGFVAFAISSAASREDLIARKKNEFRVDALRPAYEFRGNGHIHLLRRFRIGFALKHTGHSRRVHDDLRAKTLYDITKLTVIPEIGTDNTKRRLARRPKDNSQHVRIRGQRRAQMGSDESGSARYENPHATKMNVINR